MKTGIPPGGERQSPTLKPIFRSDFEHEGNYTAVNDFNEYIRDVAEKIKSLRSKTVDVCIDIGNQLIQVRKLLIEHGMWMKWLEDHVNMSYKTAQRYMRMATAYEDRTLVSNLNPTQAIILLDVDDAIREEFIKNPHYVKGESKFVFEMTASELRKVVHEATKDEAEEEQSEEDFSYSSGQQNAGEIINLAQESLEKLVSILYLNENYTVAEEFRDSVEKLNVTAHKCLELINKFEAI